MSGLSAQIVADAGIGRSIVKIGRTVGIAKVASETSHSDALDRIGTRSVVKRGATIFYEGDPADSVYKVVSGAVRTSKLMADGRRYVSDFLFPGDFFGMNDAQERALTAEALCDAIVVRYPRRSFYDVVEHEPRIGRLLLAVLCGGLATAQDRMLLLGRKTAVEKIASFLLGLAERVSANRITLPMNRLDIADHLGLTIETVSRVLSQLKGNHLIQIPDSSHVVILDRAGLSSVAEGA